MFPTKEKTTSLLGKNISVDSTNILIFLAWEAKRFFGILSQIVFCMTIRKIVGQNIRNFRKQKGWTMEKLSIRCKINYDFLGHVERGEQAVSLENLEKIAKVLGVEIWKVLYPNAPEEFPIEKKPSSSRP